MKKLILIMLLFCQVLSAPPGYQVPVILQTEPFNNLEAIWQAVIMVESSGNPDAWVIDINDKPSIGIAQIQQSRVDHFNRLTGKNYKHEDCFDLDVSKEIFMFFARRIGSEEILIRSWNGNVKSEMTRIYYEKVKRYL